jgi:tetratricopeptide (TPR) repeat protein
MKKIIFLILFNLAAAGAFAQGGAVTSAVSFQQQGILDKAKEQIDKATVHEKTKGKAKTWYYRGEIYRGIAADQTGIYSKLDTNATVVAYEAFKKATEVEPGSSFAKKAEDGLKQMHFYAGAQKYKNADYAGALELFKQATNANPQDTLPLLYAGITAQQLKEYDQAAQNFEKLIEVGTGMPDIYTTLASIYRSQNKNDQALAVLKKGTQKFPEDKALKSEEFNFYISTGRTAEAKANLEEAIKREPTNATYHLNYGLLSEQTGEPQRAQESYKKALEIDPNNVDANLSMGVLHYNKGADISKQLNAMDLKQYQKDGKKMEEQLKVHFKEALPYFQKAYQMDQTNLTVLQPLSSIYKVLEMKADEQKIQKQIESLN